MGKVYLGIELGSTRIKALVIALCGCSTAFAGLVRMSANALKGETRDLKVGLWAFPMVTDWDGDGRDDLVVGVGCWKTHGWDDAYGAVVGWMFSTMAGIRAEGPGFRRIRFAPKPDGRFGRVSASFDSPYGRIRSSWRREGLDGSGRERFRPTRVRFSNARTEPR